MDTAPPPHNHHPHQRQQSQPSQLSWNQTHNTQQVSEEQLEKLKTNVILHYNNVNNIFNSYTIFSIPSSLLRIPPVLVCLFLVIISSALVLCFVQGGLEILLKFYGLIVPLYLTWNSLYEYQPLIPPELNNNDDNTMNNNNHKIQTNTTNTNNQSLQNTPQQLIHEVPQPNNPAYLFWAKYWLLYCISIILDNYIRTILNLTNHEQWCISYSRLFNIHMFFIILPPWFYPQGLYTYLLEPLLLLHFETIFETYQATKDHFGTIAQDTLSTTTTAFRSVGKHALVGGIQSLTKNSSSNNDNHNGGSF
jgi:hypothetical protein